MLKGLGFRVLRSHCAVRVGVVSTVGCLRMGVALPAQFLVHRQRGWTKLHRQCTVRYRCYCPCFRGAGVEVSAYKPAAECRLSKIVHKMLFRIPVNAQALIRSCLQYGQAAEKRSKQMEASLHNHRRKIMVAGRAASCSHLDFTNYCPPSG